MTMMDIDVQIGKPYLYQVQLDVSSEALAVKSYFPGEAEVVNILQIAEHLLPVRPGGLRRAAAISAQINAQLKPAGVKCNILPPPS